ncbi:diguanylate cyclase [Vibrio sp. 10N.261.55.A7]|uniref:sensor domain-containing diguanylate cyclase n=1 Tax=Vibrio sp. 10N.261.55.A7 TaxID=1880851 RepID=UPI001F534319|nr:diguanylate cyclase [Vibrio sp. 10N.261.55.A7]
MKSHYDVIDRGISTEYERLNESLTRSIKILAALDYSFTNYYQTDGVLLLDHNNQIINGLCHVWPIDSLLRARGKSDVMTAVDIDYRLVGDASICDPSSPLFQRASKQVSLAPVLSFLHDLDDYLLGIHYFDTEGYVFSSPDTLVKDVTKEYLASLKSRPYWKQTARNRDRVTVSGPINSLLLGKTVMSMTVPVHLDDEFQGVISLNVDIDVLLDKGTSLSSEIRIVNRELDDVPSNAIRIKEVDFEGVVANHVFFYDLDVKKELSFFFEIEKYTLLVIFLTYIFLVLVLFYVNINMERSHFKELADKDAMTGLLNRRGLEAFLARTMHDKMFALAIFDIDDFKLVNDTYGHDVGDNVICYMADQLELNTRNHDAAARFGGEEFIVYIQGNDKQQLMKALERVKQAICEDSQKVVNNGFTVSGGVEIASPSSSINFDVLIKSADEKLYQAKTSGKNKLVY